MKKSLAIAVGSVLLLAATLPLAQDMKAPAPNAGASAMQPGPAMNVGGQMGQMDEHMKKMQALHEKMVSASTPEERQKVMEEQRKEMQSGMGMMHQMMQGGGMMGGAMMGQKGKPADAPAQMQMMQRRMDMMQMMMQSMMDQQGMMGGPKSPDSAPKT